MQEIDMSNPYDEDKSHLRIKCGSRHVLAGLFEELAKYAGMIGDDLTQDMAADRGREHKKHQWHLRSDTDIQVRDTEEDVIAKRIAEKSKS